MGLDTPRVQVPEAPDESVPAPTFSDGLTDFPGV